MRILIVPVPCPLATNVNATLFILHHLSSRNPLLQNLFRVGLHTLSYAQGAYVIACELLRQQGEEAYGAALQGSTLALDVVAEHVAEEAHLAPKVILDAPRGKALNTLIPLAAVHYVEQHGTEEAHQDAAP